MEAVADLAEFEQREPLAVLLDILPPHIKDLPIRSLLSDSLETAA